MSKRCQLIYIIIFFTISASARTTYFQDTTTIKNIIDSAFSISRKGDFIGCIELLEEPISKLQKEEFTNSISAILSNAYLVKSDALRRLGDYDIATTLYEESERMLVNCPTENCGKNLSKVYNSLGIIYRRRGKFQKSISNYKKALSTQLTLKKSSKIWQAMILNNIANCEDDFGNSEGAFLNYKKAIGIIEKSDKRYHHILAGFHGNLAESYAIAKKYDKAIHHFSKSIKIFKKNNRATEVPYQASSFKWVGSICFETGKTKEGFEAYRKAFELLGFKELNRNSFDEVKFPSSAIETLIRYAEDYLKMYKSKNDPSLLRKAKEYNELAIDFLFHVKSGFREDISKEILIRENYGAFEGAIEANYILYELEKNENHLKRALEIAEKSQNAFLMESVIRGKAVAFAGIPDSLLKKESDIKIKISDLESELIELDQEKTTNSKKIDATRQSIFEQKEKYYEVLGIYEKYYPEYFDLKYSSKTVSYDFIKDVLLPPNTSLLEFFVGKKSVFVFLLSKEKFKVFKVEKSDDFNNWVEKFQNSIANFDPLDKKGQNLNFVENGYLLYKYLIKPIENDLSKRLIIVPSGDLSNLSFDALLSDLPKKKDFGKFKSHQYFGTTHQLSYSYSATLLKEWNRPHRSKAERLLGVFAPSYSEDYSVRFGSRKLPIRDLKHSQEEAVNIAESCGGYLYLSEEADVASFQKNAGQYGTLHLAMHSFADEKLEGNSFLAFSKKEGKTNNLLYLKDLYNLSLNAEMVVLSSCQSGIGTFKSGEGIVSLARGFSYAGAKSIITTLWQINDRFSAKLMTQFYANLRKGMPKDEALQSAKTNFIQTQKERNTHPHFWAGFVPIGNMNAIEMAEGSPFIKSNSMYLLGILLVLLLIAFIIRRQKNDKSLHSG